MEWIAILFCKKLLRNISYIYQVITMNLNYSLPFSLYEA